MPTSSDRPEIVEVLSQHKTLLGLLAALERSPDPEVQLVLLDRVVGLLRPHFELEERPGGFFERVLSEAPAAHEAVDALIAEHPTLDAHAVEALAALRAAIEGPLRAARLQITRLAAEVRRHERTEAGLLSEPTLRALGELR